MIKENIKVVEQNILNACSRANRKREEVTLIAVSKTKPVEMINEAIDYGLIEFGENKVQEMTSKIEQIPQKLNWHLIGHLQTNKVKYIVDKAYMIHSVDTVKLAQMISDLAVKKDVVCDILVEVNVANEESKFGISTQNCEDFIREISTLPNIRIRGLMTIAPFDEVPENNRPYFKQLKKLLVDINSKNIDNINMDVLSMGMTNDYEIAIEEGATHVRVGTGIFGERQYL